MRFFLKKIALLFLIIFGLSFLAIILPPTPKASSSLLFATMDKNNRLKEFKNNRIIFIGGSNLSFGLNSQMIKDSLNLNPTNTAIHAGIGINFMLDYYESFIDSGDIVVVVPEYAQYFGETADGDEALFRLLLDVDNSSLSKISYRQFKNTIQFFPKFVISKFNPNEYFLNAKIEKGIYERTSFNKYGDAVAHWGKTSSHLVIEDLQKSVFNTEVLANLVSFKNKIEKKNATFFISFPCYDPLSFKINRSKINRVYRELRKRKFDILGFPSSFSFKKDLFYDSPYHLVMEGANYRTKILMNLLKKNKVLNE